MKRWITFQWPPYRDPIRRYPPRLWLEDAQREKRRLLSSGDEVFIYELGSGPAIIAEDGHELSTPIRCVTGRQGVTGIWRLKESISHDSDFPRRRYSKGPDMLWCWYADLDVIDEDGFVPCIDVKQILGWQAEYKLRGARLRPVTSEQAAALHTTFTNRHRGFAVK
jgi:hypothetical protein